MIESFELALVLDLWLDSILFHILQHERPKYT